jgi:hypothetical protein
VARLWWRAVIWGGKSARCHPGHHRDAVRIAVDGAISPEDDRRALGRDAVDGQLNGRRTSLYGEDPVTDQPLRCCRMLSEQNEIAG